MAEDRRRPLRGGRQPARDRWFGTEAQGDFQDFKRWWHRVGKEEAGGHDLRSRQDAQLHYDQWVILGRLAVR